jgi:hypothetical protein
MKKAIACGALSCIFLCIVSWASAATDLYNLLPDPGTRATLKPTPGIILVTMRQSEKERNSFYTANNEVKTLLGECATSELRARGLRKSRVIYKGDSYCTYALYFNQPGRESEIIRYLESQPGVIRARLDYPLQLLAEPNDPIYQPDAVDSLSHWVPFSLNYGNKAPFRSCMADTSDPATIMWTCCCEDPCSFVGFPLYGTLDHLHMSDQWYLQRVRANKA